MFSEVDLSQLKKFELSHFTAVTEHKSKAGKGPGSGKEKKRPKYLDEEVNPMAKIPLNKFPGLSILKIVNSPTVTNQIFDVIIENCQKLRHLEFGGRPNEYNSLITLDGIRVLCGSHEDREEYSDSGDDFHDQMGLKSNLETIKVHYCVKIGGQAMELITKRFGDSLKNFSILRNYYEFSAKITDDALKNFEKCPNLEKLEIVYSRNLDWDCVKYLSLYCKNLRVLNLKDCPVQESLEPLALGCPYLEELNMSGDSWVKEEALIGL